MWSRRRRRTQDWSCLLLWQACRGIRLIYSYKTKLVDIKEMSEVLTVEKKAADLEVNAWVRIKIGLYKGDLAQVVDVDNVKQQATVKLVPRVDLAALEAKQAENKPDVPIKKKQRPPARFFSVDEAKSHGLKMNEVRDKETNEFVYVLEGMRFKDSYFWKTVSLKSLDKSGIVPTLDELQNFQKPAGDGDDESTTLLAPKLAQQQRARLMKGDVVQVVEGDLKGLMGTVEKVDGDEIIIKPRHKDLKEPLPVFEKQLRKFFKTGDHVKVIAGMHDGATGLIVKVEEQVVVLLTDTSQEHIKVFARDIVSSAEVTSGITQFGDYELHDLIILDQLSFGVIVKLEQGGCQVLRNSPNRSDVAAVKFPDIKRKLFDRKATAEDGHKNPMAVKDPVRILDGPWKGRQGVVEHLHRGVAFVFDRTFAQNGGFFCVRARSCCTLAGTNNSQGVSAADPLQRRRGYPYENERNGMLYSPVRQNLLQSPRNYMNGSGRGAPGGHGSFGGGRSGHRRDHDSIVGTITTIRMGNYKGYKGRVVDATDTTVRVELESQMKIITVKREHLPQGGAAPDHSAAAPYAPRESPRYGAGSETPMHGSTRTPMHPGSFFGGMRDPMGTPVHEGMRTPMHDRAWNPHQAPATPLRGQDAWEMGDTPGGPSSWPPAGGYQAQGQPFTPAYSPTDNAASPVVMENPSTPAGARPYEGVPASPRGGAAGAGGWGGANGRRDDAPSPYGGGAPSPYRNPSTPGTGGYNPMTPGGASASEYLPSTPLGGFPSTPGSVAGGGEEQHVGTPSMTPGGAEVAALMVDVAVTLTATHLDDDQREGVVREVLGDGAVFKVASGPAGDGEIVQVGPGQLEVVQPRLFDRVKVIVPGEFGGRTGKLVSLVNNDGVVKLQGGAPEAFNLVDLGKYVA
eukprot:TRINITY_DN8372_c1_g1_i1.p1 TRINITY_DN8372_c1_g1~~TRINITY_DN8372_c1_g1_i1.p1  ORF type:complete len:907 (-),score=231.98 TRINITY_DN8372_c1_g1_i1:513-3233(-)